MAFEQFLQLIRSGEPVSAGVANRTAEQNDRNIRYLWDLIQAANLGATVYLRKKTVESDALVGQPVYLNSITQQFELGLARTSTALDGTILAAESADVWGVVAFKHSATLADILIYGVAELDLTYAVAGPVVAGLYYLSGVTAGRLVKQRPPVSVPVLRADGRGSVFVNPRTSDFIDRHTHYRASLACVPAGDTSPPVAGARHVLTNPDATIDGWLPADHVSFGGHAPAGAMFGYNIAANAALLANWPPIPVNVAYLEWDKALSDDVGFTGVPLGPRGLAVIDRYGIWWMSNCFGDVPWPIGFDSASVDSISESIGECPRELMMAMTIWFTKFNFATNTSVVTTLVSADDRVIVKCIDGAPGSAGDLQILLNLGFQVSAIDTRGSLVLKSLVGDKFVAGRVVEGIYAKSSSVVLSSELPTILRDPLNPASEKVYQGLVAISVLPQTTLELPVLLTRLDGATEEFLTEPPLMYIGLAAGELQAFRSKLQVPFDIGLSGLNMALRMTVLGRAAGALPVLTITARRVPRGTSTPQSIPVAGAEFSVTIDTTGTLSASNQYIEVESDPFTVAAGDLVFFQVSRLASDGYAGEVGILQQAGILTGE